MDDVNKTAKRKFNFLALSIFLSTLLLSAAIVFYALCNRYVYISSTTPIFDKLTGTYYTINGSDYEKITVYEKHK